MCQLKIDAYHEILSEAFFSVLEYAVGKWGSGGMGEEGRREKEGEGTLTPRLTCLRRGGRSAGSVHDLVLSV